MDADRTTAVRTGIFTISVLLALALIVASLNRDAGIFVSRYRLYADFDNIEGLFSNSPVRLAGTHIGRVTEVRFLPPGSARAIRIEMDLDASLRERIRSDSVASIHQSGVLGDMYVEVTLGGEGAEPLEDGATLASREPLSFRELADAGGELLPTVGILGSTGPGEQRRRRCGRRRIASSASSTRPWVPSPSPAPWARSITSWARSSAVTVCFTA